MSWSVCMHACCPGPTGSQQRTGSQCHLAAHTPYTLQGARTSSDCLGIGGTLTAHGNYADWAGLLKWWARSRWLPALLLYHKLG